jgi:hypothetical protein
LLPTPRQQWASAWASREAKTALARRDRAAAVAALNVRRVDDTNPGRDKGTTWQRARWDRLTAGTDAGAGPRRTVSTRARDALGTRLSAGPDFISVYSCLTGPNSKSLNYD